MSLFRVVSFFFFIYLSFGTQAEVLKIMCLGDSITEGGNTYREPLYDLLKKSGIDFTFVGTKSKKYGEYELFHEGYSGKNVEFLLQKFPELLSKNTPDILLIHAGHNHFEHEKPVAGIVASTEKIVALALQKNPQMKIFIALPIFSGKLPKYSYLPELNASLLKSFKGKSSIYIVDMNEKFTWQKHALPDYVHPNQKGAEVMAQLWFNALNQNALSK